MQQDNSSFWTEIKEYEERLAKSPDSLCFARLSEIYLKVGLLDDALHIARRGLEIHPAYLAGHRALALACHARGINDESIESLKVLAAGMPEDLDSLKLLGRLSSETGDFETAARAFRTALEFAPNDAECCSELERIDQPPVTDFASENAEDGDEEIIEDLEILEELEILDEDEYCEEQEQGQSLQFDDSGEEEELPADSGPLQHDPLSTGTLAELYAAQGYTDKALEIYRSLLNDDPTNMVLKNRVCELEARLQPEEPAAADDYSPSQDLPTEFDLINASETSGLTGELESIALASAATESLAAESLAFEDVQPVPAVPVTPVAFAAAFDAAVALPANGSADNAIATLEKWLANIGRIRSCR